MVYTKIIPSFKGLNNYLRYIMSSCIRRIQIFQTNVT